MTDGEKLRNVGWLNYFTYRSQVARVEIDPYGGSSEEAA
jgi:hypothetical protein